MIRFESLTEKHRRMILDCDLPDRVIAERLGISLRSLFRYRRRLLDAS